MVGFAVPVVASAAPLTLQSVRVDKTGIPEPLAWTIPDAAAGASFSPEAGTASYSFPMPAAIPDGGVTVTISADVKANAGSKLAATIGVDGDVVKRGPVIATAMASSGESDHQSRNVTLVRGPEGLAIVRLALLDGPRYTYTYRGPGALPSVGCGAGAAAAAVTVACLQDDVAYHKRGRPPGEWLRLYETTILRPGDQVSASADGVVTLSFPNKSTLVLQHSAEVQILPGSAAMLGMGEVVASAGRPGLRLITPSYTATAKSTSFTAFYDPGSKSGLLWTKAGSATVNPTAPKLATTAVAHGKEVEVTPKAISHLAKVGRADARGGLNRARAFELVAKVVSRFNGPCNARTLHTNGIAVTPASGGWRVTVKLAGGLKGAATWTVRGKRVTPANGIAAKLASGCR